MEEQGNADREARGVSMQAGRPRPKLGFQIRIGHGLRLGIRRELGEITVPAGDATLARKGGERREAAFILHVRHFVEHGRHFPFFHGSGGR